MIPTPTVFLLPDCNQNSRNEPEPYDRLQAVIDVVLQLSSEPTRSDPGRERKLAEPKGRDVRFSSPACKKHVATTWGMRRGRPARSQASPELDTEADTPGVADLARIERLNQWIVLGKQINVCTVV